MEVGIDFGTTFSTICATSGDIEGCIKIFGSQFIETQVFVDFSNSSFEIGKAAAAKLRAGDDGRMYVNPKRWVGVNESNFAEFMQKLKPTYTVKMSSTLGIQIGGLGKGEDKLLPVTDIICMFLRGLIKECEFQTGKTVTGAVVTVPADYNSYKRAFVITALRGIGVPVRAIINEPTAAAIHSLAKTKLDDLFVSVFDFGGGTFDASFVKKKGDILGVIYSVGDNFLGGRDIDRKVGEKLSQLTGNKISPTNLILFSSVVKEEVSLNPERQEHLIPIEDGVVSINFTAEDLDEIVKPFAEKAREVFEKGAIRFSPDSSVAVLTGGSSALREVRRVLSESRYISKVLFDISDFRASVAIGAKIYSDILTGRSQLRLVDSLTNTLSDEIAGFLPIVIFPKGCPIPCSYSTSYTVDGNVVVYGVYEGEGIRSYFNELTFSGVYTHSDSSKRSERAQYNISIDGTMELYVNGVKLINTLVPPEPSQFSKDIQYEISRGRVIAQAVDVYTKQINLLKLKQLTPEDIRLGTEKFISTSIPKNYDLLNKWRREVVTRSLQG